MCFAGAGVEGCGGGSTGGSSSSGGGSGSSSGGSGSGSGGMVVAGCDDGGVCVQQPPRRRRDHLDHAAELRAAPPAPGRRAERGERAGLAELRLQHRRQGHDRGAHPSRCRRQGDRRHLHAGGEREREEPGRRRPGGIDNSFGANIVVGLLSAVISNPSATIDTSLAEGALHGLMNVTGMSGDFGQTATGLTGYILGGVPFAQAPNGPDAGPTFTLSDTWPVDPGSLKNPPRPLDDHPHAGTTVDGHVHRLVHHRRHLRERHPHDVSLTLSITASRSRSSRSSTRSSPSTIRGTPANTNISGGIIAGVIDAEQLVTNLQAVAGNIETSLCQGSTFAQLKQPILGTADIMDDGTNEPGRPATGFRLGSASTPMRSRSRPLPGRRPRGRTRARTLAPPARTPGRTAGRRTAAAAR